LHQSEKSDPDPLKREKRDPDHHQIEMLDPHPLKREKMDPDSHQSDGDPRPCSKRMRVFL
jgi:hypothetical protein